VKGFRKDGTLSTDRRTKHFDNYFHQDLEEIKSSDLFRKVACLESSCDSKISIQGKTYLDFSSNDYLNLSTHPEIVKAASNALLKYGLGSGASRLLSGSYMPHKKLEERIAKFKRARSALVFNTGYAANTGIIPVIAVEGDEIFSDELNHASIIDGTRLSAAEVRIYKHKDLNQLETLLKKSLKRKNIRRRVIITDTVFSMDGDMALLDDLVCLSQRYGTLLMIDDAHGTGVLGKTGRGALEHFGIKSGNIIQMGTLSKAAGAYGAYVAGKKDLIELLINRSRSFIYSTSLPPLIAEAGKKAIEIIESRSVRLRNKLWKNRNRLNDGLISLGFDTLKTETPIIPVMVGDAVTAMKLGKRLYSEGIFAPAIRPPTVKEGTCRIRFSVTSGHTDKDIDHVLNVMENIK
jgi:8-amino-7-oxononanoate synthase